MFMHLACHSSSETELTVDAFLKELNAEAILQFVHLARQRLCRNVELTAEAMELIGDLYAELRGNADARALPVTVRFCRHCC